MSKPHRNRSPHLRRLRPIIPARQRTGLSTGQDPAFPSWTAEKSARPKRMRTTSQFAARNDFTRPLGLQEFGRRFNGYLAAAYGIDGRHSNGTVFDGVSLAPLSPLLAMNGAA